MEELNKEKGYIESQRIELKQAEKSLQTQLNLLKETREQELIEKDFVLRESQTKLMSEK